MSEKNHQNKKTNYALIFLLAILAVMFYAVLRFIFNYSDVMDYLRSINYQPSAEIATIEKELRLTEKGKLIFAASDPTLEERDHFNAVCNSHNEDVSVLGCYTKRHIYLYNINSDELDGIVESTAAHELLHAVWERLPITEQTRLSAALEEVYRVHRDELSDELDSYETAEQLDELHARAGTQIADLPEILEKHYAKYFLDQDLVVGFYDDYSEPFKILSDEMDAVSKDLDTLKSELEQKTKEYYERANTLSADIDKFNECANANGCFSSTAAFNARRNELIAEQSKLDELYSDLDALVKECNEKVAEYNNNILRSENLEKIVNSNAPIEREL